MPDIARLIAVADLLVDAGHRLDRTSIACEAAEQVARLTRSGRALVELVDPGGHVYGSYPGAVGSLDEGQVLESRIGADRTRGTVRVADPIDGSFTHLDSWLVDVVARRVESQLAVVELHESELSSREAVRDAELAGELQRALVSAERLSLDGIEAAGRLIPARRVGGDVFDLVEVDGGIMAVLADVSGKGAPASLLTSAVLSSVHQQTLRNGLRPGAMLRAIGESMAPMLERTGRLVTLVIAAVEASSGELRIASAGHHPVLLAGADSVEVISATAPPLGVVVPGEDERIHLMDTETALLLASDGLTDQRDPSGRPFGLDSLATAFANRIEDAPQIIADHLLDAIDHHADGAQQDDDQAVVVMASTGVRR